MQVTGLFHVAIKTNDLDATVKFYTDVLGMKLKALYWMHGVEGYFHAFMELNPHCCIAFVAAPSFFAVIFFTSFRFALGDAAPYSGFEPRSSGGVGR
mgnify:CR=1 FL=1